MIAHLSGKILFRGTSFVLLDVSGIGFKVIVSAETLKSVPASGGQCSMYTYQYIRENSMELYGFKALSEVEFFEMLISVPGIGPKSAIGVLSVAPIDILKRAIASGEAQQLTKVSGIGRRTAEKIVVELRERLSGGEDSVSGSDEADVLDALMSLGYSGREAREAIRKAANNGGSLDEKIKEALKILGS